MVAEYVRLLFRRYGRCGRQTVFSFFLFPFRNYDGTNGGKKFLRKCGRRRDGRGKRDLGPFYI